MSTEVLQVINRGDKTFSFKYGGTPYVLPPDGAPRAIPGDAVKMVCGDWTARDTEHDAARAAVRKSLNVRYGLFNAPFYADEPRLTVGLEGMIPPEPVEPYTEAPEALVEGRWAFMHPNLPRLEVRTFDGERIYTVLDDPDGDMVNGQRQAQLDAASTDALLEAIKEKDRQIDKIISAMSRLDPVVAATLAAERNTPGVALDPAGSAIHDPLAPSDDDATSTVDAMSIMDEELGTKTVLADDTSTDTPRPSKKAAAKKAPAPRPSQGDEL